MNTIEQFIENFLNACDFEDPVEATAETELQSLPQWDSLAKLAVIVLFDTEYGKTITGEDLKNAVTVGDIFRLLGE
ncbi:MAG: acyl carrier protein [Zoogloeaceae bacterium]|jgi:acyl carrier protein|nr:acyl carrier protein [Zoogloeaceae bacterium]